MVKEFVLWGTRDGVEDVVRVNGHETFSSLSEVEKFKKILIKRGGFDKLRIQVVDLGKWDIKSDFIGGLK
jgi:hypothetical protein